MGAPVAAVPVIAVAIGPAPPPPPPPPHATSTAAAAGSSTNFIACFNIKNLSDEKITDQFILRLKNIF
jgi:hypothetical protein